jgi:hypothetical protein
VAAHCRLPTVASRRASTALAIKGKGGATLGSGQQRSTGKGRIGERRPAQAKTTVPWQGDDSLTDKTGEWALALRGGRMATLGDDLRGGKKG